MSTVSGSGSSDTPNPIMEVRECVCGREFEVVTEHAKPWTVCRDCMFPTNPYLTLSPCPTCGGWDRHPEDCPNA